MIFATLNVTGFALVFYYLTLLVSWIIGNKRNSVDRPCLDAGRDQHIKIEFLKLYSTFFRQENLRQLAEKFNRKVGFSKYVFYSSMPSSISVSEFIQIILTSHVPFVFQAMLRESWLDDMMHVLEQEESGDDISTADSTLKRHEAISHDIQSRVRSMTFSDTKELTFFTRNRSICDQ